MDMPLKRGGSTEQSHVVTDNPMHLSHSVPPPKDLLHPVQVTPTHLFLDQARAVVGLALL